MARLWWDGLKPGVTAAQATQDLNTLGAWLAKTYPSDDEGVKFTLARPGLIGDMLGGPARAFMAGLMLLAGLILLAACANLGSLFAARAADRAKETALRLALGSRRGMILRQMLTEAVLVSLAGGALGLAGGVAILRLLSAWQPIPDTPINVPVNPDAATYVVALVLALASGLLFGMVPVRQVSAGRSVAGDSHGRGKCGRAAAIHAARCSAGGADCDLCGAGDIFAGGGARAGAIDAQQFRFCAAERDAREAPSCIWRATPTSEMPQMQRRMLDAAVGHSGRDGSGLCRPLAAGSGGRRLVCLHRQHHRLPAHQRGR